MEKEEKKQDNSESNEVIENKVVVLKGRLDTIAASEIDKEMQPLYGEEYKSLTFDCTDLEYISSSGLRLFFNVLRHCSPKQIPVSILNPNDFLMDVFNTTGFTKLLKIERSK